MLIILRETHYKGYIIKYIYYYNYTAYKNVYYLFFPLMRFDPIPCHALPLRSSEITLIGHTTLSRIPLDE